MSLILCCSKRFQQEHLEHKIIVRIIIIMDNLCMHARKYNYYGRYEHTVVCTCVVPHYQIR